MDHLNKYIDHSILKSDCKIEDIEQICREAILHNFAAVCIPPYYISLASKLLKDSEVKVATVIGFPMGYSSTKSKLQEIKDAISDGADEIDFVQNISAVLNEDYNYLSKEINVCLQPIRLNNKIIKVILETGILSDNNIIECCKIYARAKVDFIKTSTGYASKGASIEAIRLIKQHIPESISIKASGGIKDYDTTMLMIEAGASRIGTSSGIKIVLKK